MIFIQTLLNMSSSFDEINVSALIERQNIDLTTDKENRKPKRRKRVVPLERKKKNCYEIQDPHTELLKEVLKYLNGRYALVVGLLVDSNVFLSSSSGNDVILSKDIGLWEISMPEEF